MLNHINIVQFLENSLNTIYVHWLCAGLGFLQMSNKKGWDGFYFFYCRQFSKNLAIVRSIRDMNFLSSHRFKSLASPMYRI